MRHHSYFDLHENEPVGETHFHMNAFALTVVLTERQKATREWPISDNFVVFARNCPASTLDYIVMQIRNANHQIERAIGLNCMN